MFQIEAVQEAFGLIDPELAGEPLVTLVARFAQIASAATDFCFGQRFERRAQLRLPFSQVRIR
ncbi:hypothetical protein LJR034_003035 [Caballeronia sp. LjRoot34]